MINRFWCLGFFLDVVDEKNIRIEHLKHKKEDQTMPIWINPNNDDIQIVKDCQVLPCDVDRYWEFSNPECSTIIVNDLANIEMPFRFLRCAPKSCQWHKPPQMHFILLNHYTCPIPVSGWAFF